MVKRNYPPGMHGQNRARLSEFAMHHREKQKAKWIYQVTERQFANYVRDAARKRAMTGDMLLQFLESRLDNVVYRLGLATSRAQARQFVGHGFVTVNAKRVNIPSYQVAVGSTVAINPSKKSSKLVERLAATLKDSKTQDWVELDAKNLSGKVLSKPTPQLTGSTLQMDLIVEHYNR